MSTAEPPRPFFLPEMAIWARPVWIATWAALIYSALVLLPAWLPVYGDLLPGWLWIGVPVQVFAHVGIAWYREILKRNGAGWFLVAGVTTTGTSFIFTVGLYILMSYQPTAWETLGLSAFGVFCLAFLVVLDRFGFVLETSRDLESLPGTLGPAALQANVWFNGILFWVLLALVVVILATVAAILLMS